MQERNSIFYDLEGPISSLDHAQAVCKRFVKDGGKLFPVLSRYDDVLALANKEGYEPGDTLMLQIPFLIEAGVAEEDLRTVSTEAGLVSGIYGFFTELQKEGCAVWIISTSYEQHALSIAERVGVPLNQVHCTKFQLDIIRRDTGREDLGLIREVREKAVKLYHDNLESGANDGAIQELLDPFFWEELPKSRFGQMSKVEVMGGRRKVKALEKASGHYFLSNAFVVMDSITDFRMSQVVEAAGGIALAWNANWYVLPYASCGVAAVDARAVRPLFKAWQEGGRPTVREFVESALGPEDPEVGPYYHWLAGREEKFKEDIVLPIHKRLRTTCRGKEVAKLG